MCYKDYIEHGNAVVGIELGSTRIKAVMINESHQVIASGSSDWENQLIHNVWTYDIKDIWDGLRECYANLKADVKEKYDAKITSLAAIGISGMMHGYMVFDKGEDLLVPFRTWRNTMTSEAAEKLTQLFQFNIPDRWSIAHLYQAILNQEEHIKKIDYITTLAGYIHWQLTGAKVLGIGDVSGMFPIDSKNCNYQSVMLDHFDECIREYDIPWRIREILPTVQCAGDLGGTLSDKGALLLDPTGELMAGIKLCPPEGDAGTGMVATNSVNVRTGNVSAGTSIFAMIVLEDKLSKLYREIDLVTTPSGEAVAMSHANNCTTDLNEWVSIFEEFTKLLHIEINKSQIYSLLYNKALEGDSDCGGLLPYGYYSGEGITGLNEGRPLFVRKPDSTFDLANFMRANLYTALGALKIGMDILMKTEHVKLDVLIGHGGFFKTAGVGQKIMADGMDVPVMVMENAGEGGAWGIALLAAYMIYKVESETLGSYLQTKIFSNVQGSVIHPDIDGVNGFEQFMERYKKGLVIEKEAVKSLV